MKSILLLVSTLLISLTFAELPQSYQSFYAAQKQSLLWDKIVTSQYQNLPPVLSGGWGSILLKLKSFITLGETFNFFSDEMPASRGKNKLLHSSGTVVKINYIAVKNNSYTGLFKTGAKGLARFSLAGNTESIGSYTPGFALKLLVDGQPSCNVAVMYGLEGQGKNKDFFANDFTNRIPEPKSFTLGLLSTWFKVFVKNPFFLGTDHFASVTPNGEAIKNFHSPYQLIFQPNRQLAFSPDTQEDFRSELGKIDPGTLLYTVKALAFEGDDAKIIGFLYSKSHFLASEYGDHQLFFQHRE